MILRNQSRLLGLLAVAGLLAGCVSTARLYDLQTGDVIHLRYEDYGIGHGAITGTMPDGQPLQGEYSTISGIGLSSTMGSAYGIGSGGFAWATAQGFSLNQPGVQYGAATLDGRGVVIQAVYAVDPWTGHGHGVAKDNHGENYSLQF